MSDYIKKNRSAIGEGIYLLYFAIMIGARAAGLYEGMTVYNISLLLGLFLFALKMVVTKYSLKEYAICAAFLLLSGIVYAKTGEKGLLVCFTMMLGMKGVSVMKVVKTGIIVAGVIVLIRVFTGAFGFVNGIYYPQEREGVGLMFRESLGSVSCLYAAANGQRFPLAFYESKPIARGKTLWLFWCKKRPQGFWLWGR
jgi:hypothetical protein